MICSMAVSCTQNTPVTPDAEVCGSSDSLNVVRPGRGSTYKYSCYETDSKRDRIPGTDSVRWLEVIWPVSAYYSRDGVCLIQNDNHYDLFYTQGNDVFYSWDTYPFATMVQRIPWIRLPINSNTSSVDSVKAPFGVGGWSYTCARSHCKGIDTLTIAGVNISTHKVSVDLATRFYDGGGSILYTSDLTFYLWYSPKIGTYVRKEYLAADSTSTGSVMQLQQYTVVP